MSAGLIVLLSILCVGFYTGQSFLNRLFSGSYTGSPETATPVFSCIYGAVVLVVTFLLNGCRFSPSGLTVLFGIIDGLILFFYNLGMIQTAHRGPFTFQTIVRHFGSILLCLLSSVLLWGDRITGTQLAGIGVMLLALVVLNAGGFRFTEVKKGYFFWVFSLFLTNGLYGVLMDSQQRMFPEERNEMIMITFGSLAVISGIFLLCTKGKDAPAAFAMSPRAAACAVGSSLCAAFAVYLLMFLLRYVPGFIMFTVNNGAVLVMIAILSAVILKEKPSRATIAGVILSLISIALLSV